MQPKLETFFVILPFQVTKLLLLRICSSDDLSSSSVESLDSDSEDSDFQLEPEPEAWSVTVNKDRLQTMSARDIKRQDHIWGTITQLPHIHSQKSSLGQAPFNIH